MAPVTETVILPDRELIAIEGGCINCYINTAIIGRKTGLSIFSNGTDDKWASVLAGYSFSP